MNQKQFEVLVACKLLENNKISQRKIAQHCAISLGSTNKLLTDLLDLGMILEDYALTSQGQEFLNANKVKRAIILAAGFGERLMPLTLNTAKPLLRIHNIRIIDTILEAITNAGIEEIIIVRGHLKDQFDDLKHTYPNLKFIDNDLYNESKNIRSICLAKEYLERAYVFEADLLVQNKAIITPYQLNTTYYGKKTDLSNDWCFKVKSGIITDIGIGGENVYEMAGISYWTADDAVQLSKDLEEAIHLPGGLEKFWDDIPLKDYKNNYKIYITECKDEDIIEINTFSQIQQMDPIYLV